MKIITAIISGIAIGTLASPVFADHNSKFGDNTGRTIEGVHDNRIESNLKSSANSDAMGKNTSSVKALGTLGDFAQSGHPETVVPGLIPDYDDELTF